MKVAKHVSAGIPLLLLAAFLFCIRSADAESTAPGEASEVALRSTLPNRPHLKRPASKTIALTRQLPKTIRKLDVGGLQIDFGKVAFGNLELTSPDDFRGSVVVRFGEKLLDGSIDRVPPGTVRYSEVLKKIAPGETVIIAPPADGRNTQQSGKVGRSGTRTPPAVLTPLEWGVVTPFRWIEIEGLPEESGGFQFVRRAAFPRHWDESTASFVCSDDTINRVWELCRYSIKATLFAGVYVDGDRERIPYEADAYLNQLSHYYVDHDPGMARLTFDWLLEHPTWPTEWGVHMIFMAHADWMHYGDADWIAEQYEALKEKSLIDRCGALGLVESNQQQMDWNDIVDWPPSERDGHINSEVNTVVNAFHYAAIVRMAELADVVGANEDAERYTNHAARVKRCFNEHLFDADTGLYRDGHGVDHHSLHANFFPLAVGLVPADKSDRIVEWLTERGMRCSVYGAQYFLEALFENGAGKAAVELMIARGERSWRHMLDRDATITWEAWNESAKPNLDWNHAWGAAPANLLPRYVLGAQPLAPGWSRARIRPSICGLKFARGTVPTPDGPVDVAWQRQEGFSMRLHLPDGMTASVHVPIMPGAEEPLVDGRPVEVERDGDYWILKQDVAGEVQIDVR